MSRPLNNNLLFIGAIAATLFVAASAWDEEDGRKRAAELKDQAIKYAVEHYGRHEYFASDAHCRVPLKGERLVMQRASPRDPGKGYRCTYFVVMTPPGTIPVANVTWSRSPEAARTIVRSAP